MLSEQAILEYQSIYKKHFGRRLSFNEAKIEAERFLRFFKFLLEIKLKNHDK